MVLNLRRSFKSFNVLRTILFLCNLQVSCSASFLNISSFSYNRLTLFCILCLHLSLKCLRKKSLRMSTHSLPSEMRQASSLLPPETALLTSITPNSSNSDLSQSIVETRFHFSRSLHQDNYKRLLKMKLNSHKKSQNEMAFSTNFF